MSSAAAKVACPACNESVHRPFSCKLCELPGCIYCRPACATEHLAFTFSIATQGKPQGCRVAEPALTMKEAAKQPPPASVSAQLFPLPW